MLKLKSESLKQCFFVLREFVEGADSNPDQKGMAHLALEQLQRVTAGNTTVETDIPADSPLDGTPDCVYRPRADN